MGKLKIMAARLSRHRRLLGVLLFVAILYAAFELSGMRQHFSLEYLRGTIDRHRIGGLMIFILLFSLGNLIQIPGTVFLAAAVLALGKTMGGLATYAAASVSCVLTFLAIRLVGGDALRQFDNAIAARLLRRLDAAPVKSILLLRLLFQTVPALNYALALSGVRLRHYLAGTLLGLPLPIVLYCLLFDYLGRELGIP